MEHLKGIVFCADAEFPSGIERVFVDVRGLQGGSSLAAVFQEFEGDDAVLLRDFRDWLAEEVSVVRQRYRVRVIRQFPVA